MGLFQFNKADVHGYQSELLAQGYDLGRWGADGSYGPATKAALTAFQEDHGLAPTGTPNDLTLPLLVTKREERLEAVKAKQTALASIPGCPQGLGYWVAYENAIHPGGEKEDLARGIDWAKRTGATWVCLRAGDGTDNDRDFDQTSVTAWRDAGFTVIAWIFSRPDNIMREAPAYKRCFDKGCHGVAFNAEFEYLGETEDEARRFVEAVRNYGIPFVAHAPPDYNGGLNIQPWNSLDKECDAIMPQVYAFEHNDAGHVYHLTQVLKNYLAKGTPQEKLWPVLCSYRPKFRGFDTNPKTGVKDVPRRTPPMANEGQRVADDILAGLKHEWTRTSIAPSVYTLDAINFINGKDDKVIVTLEKAYQEALAKDKAAWEAHQAHNMAINEAWSPKSLHEVLHTIYE